MKWNIDFELVGANVDGHQGPARMASAKAETGNHTRYPFINVYLVRCDTVNVSSSIQSTPDRSETSLAVRALSLYTRLPSYARVEG